MGMILTALFAVISANALWELLSILASGIVGGKEKDMSDKYVTLDEFMNERGEWVKQIVYRVDGDFNGDIKGENVTVILMGNGNINGNIDAKNGEVFVHHGNINGNVKADKVLCPTPPNNKLTNNGLDWEVFYVDWLKRQNKKDIDIDPWDGEKPHAKGGFVEKYCL